MELAPGQETTLRLALDVRQRLGPQRLSCSLIEANGPIWTYVIETTIYARVQFSDQAALHVGMVESRSETVRGSVLLLRAENQQNLPSGVSLATNSDHLQIETAEAPVKPQADGTVLKSLPLTLRLRSPELPGQGLATLTARFERAGATGSVTLGVTWYVRSPYVLSPPEVFFGTLDASASEEIERRVTIRRADDQPLRVKKVVLPSAALRWSAEPNQEGQATSLRLFLNPLLAKDTLWGELLVETDHPQQPRLRVPVAAVRSPN